MTLTDQELSLSVELWKTRASLARMQVRACQNEMQLAQLMEAETLKELQALFSEQERRDAVKTQQPAPVVEQAAPTVTVEDTPAS